MKQYICLNHGECNWADEIPPRQFRLPEAEENVCPNCDSSNIREAIGGKKPSWIKPAIIIGILCLAGIIWWLWPPTTQPQLLIKVVGLNCQNGILSLTTVGGDDSPVTFEIEGLGASKNNEFRIPRSKRYGKSFKLFAIQNGVTVNTTYTTHCPVPLPPPPPHDPIDTTVESKDPTAKWTRVEGSNFCVGECVLSYSETDNLGHFRERRVENYSDCCPADK